MKPDFLHHARATAFVSLALLLPAVAAGEAGTTSCFDGDPAEPIEQFRTLSGQGTFEMWPADLRPADALGQPLPIERDSTLYNGFQRPGQNSGDVDGDGMNDGLEFFYDLDIEESAGGTYLYMAYNAGFQIWNIHDTAAASPVLLSQRDGWLGDFHDFQETPTEIYFLIFGIDAIDPPGAPGNTLIALSGLGPVGPTIWDASDKADPTQLYQDEGKTGIQVAAANIGNRSYAFFSNGDGVHVYDMTRAREVGPCFENTNTATAFCGGSGNPVWRGRLGPWPWGRVEYLDVLEAQISGQTKHFIAVSDAFFFNGLGVEIREITDATSLPPTSSSVIEGLHTLSFGVDLFEYGGRHYLGAVSYTDLEIHDVTACLASAAGCSLASPEFDVTTATDGDFPSLSFVQYSEADGRPFLYKGFSAACSTPPAVGGPNQEMLLDLTGLDTGDAIVEIVGGEYMDPNQINPQQRINYWSSYYDKSTDGYSAFAPHAGKFHGTYFYRAGQSMFDIHEWTGDVPPSAEIQATNSNRWLSTPAQDEWISLSGECTSGVDTGWSWSASNAAGEPPVDPVPVVEPLGGALARVRGDLCAADTYPTAICPDRTILTDADVNCDTLALTSNELALTLQDPRPFFDSIGVLETPRAAGPPPEYPVCQALSFQALSGAANQTGGKAPVTYTWEITPEGGGTTLSCTSAAASSGLACTETTLAWNTVGVDAGATTFIFSDGFESGNTSRWSNIASRGPALAAAAAPEGATSRLAEGAKGVAASGVTFDVTLTATNEHGSILQATQVTLTPLEAFEFTGGGFTIPSPPPVLGDYELTATALGATSFRWEFEQDPSLPGDAGCLYVTPCAIVTTTSATVQYQWPLGNVNGADYEVWLEIANCDASIPPLATSRTVQNTVVVVGVAPDLTDFRVVTFGAPCQCSGAGCLCAQGEVSFTVAIDGECSSVSFDWGDGTTSSGLPCDQATYVRDFTTSGTFVLEAEACFGVACDTQVNLTNISPPVPLTIQ